MISKRHVAIILFNLLFFVFHPRLTQADTISVVADRWCPYNCEFNAEKPGILIEIAKRIFEAYGDTISYEVMPWSRAKDEVRLGKFNAIVGCARGDAPDFIFPERGLVTLSNVFFVKSGETWNYSGIQSLSSRRLGAIRDYSYTEDVDEYISANKENNARVQFVSGESALELNIKKLLSDRINVLVDDANVVRYTAQKLGVEEQLREAGVARSEAGYIAFSPVLEKSKIYAELLSKGIEELKNNGELNKIYEHYGLTLPK